MWYSSLPEWKCEKAETVPDRTNVMFCQNPKRKPAGKREGQTYLEAPTSDHVSSMVHPRLGRALVKAISNGEPKKKPSVKRKASRKMACLLLEPHSPVRPRSHPSTTLPVAVGTTSALFLALPREPPPNEKAKRGLPTMAKCLGSRPLCQYSFSRDFPRW